MLTGKWHRKLGFHCLSSTHEGTSDVLLSPVPLPLHLPVAFLLCFFWFEVWFSFCFSWFCKCKRPISHFSRVLDGRQWFTAPSSGQNKKKAISRTLVERRHHGEFLPVGFQTAVSVQNLPMPSSRHAHLLPKLGAPPENWRTRHEKYFNT